MPKHIAVVGAGPAGGYISYLLARAGHDVTLFEEHKGVGCPIQCTGILTAEIHSIAPLAEVVEKARVNTITKASIYAPDGSYVTFRLKRPNIIIARDKFDALIAHKAQDAGVHLETGNKVSRISHEGLMVKGESVERPFDIIIGADGPNSIVRKYLNPEKALKRDWGGIQVGVALDNNNIVEFYPHIGTYAWVVPDGNGVARIGLVGRKHVKEQFERFLESRIGKDPKIVDRQAGIIPYYQSNLRTQKDNLYLLGDAATQVKATTGGGIIPGLEAAEALADAVETGSDYPRLWKKRIAKNLWAHRIMRDTFDKYTERDYNRLVALFKRRAVKRIIEEGDREYPLRYLMKLAIIEPRLVLLGLQTFFRAQPQTF